MDIIQLGRVSEETKGPVWSIDLTDGKAVDLDVDPFKLFRTGFIEGKTEDPM